MRRQPLVCCGKEKKLASYGNYARAAAGARPHCASPASSTWPRATRCSDGFVESVCVTNVFGEPVSRFTLHNQACGVFRLHKDRREPRRKVGYCRKTSKIWPAP